MVAAGRYLEPRAAIWRTRSLLTPIRSAMASSDSPYSRASSMARARFFAWRALLASASLIASLAVTARSRAFHAFAVTGRWMKGITLVSSTRGL